MIYTSDKVSASLVTRGEDGGNLGYVADVKPTGTDVASITASLVAAGCKPRLVTKHLDYVFGASSWKDAILYTDGVISTIDVLALRKAAFKRRFFAWFAKYRNQHAKLPLDFEFFIALGYRKSAKLPTSPSPTYCYGEIYAGRQGDGGRYILTPPDDGVPDICDGLIAMTSQGQYEDSTYLSPYFFQWADGERWWVSMKSDGSTYSIPAAMEPAYSSSLPLMPNPGPVSQAGGHPAAEVARVVDLIVRRVLPEGTTYEALCASSKQTSVRGLKLRHCVVLPLSAGVEQIWWTVGDLPLGVLPAKLIVGNRGCTVKSSALGTAIEQYALDANDSNALATAAEMKASDAVWQLQYIGPRVLRRKASETAIAGEGDISTLMDELVIEPGRTTRYPSGVTLRQLETALMDRAAREGTSFSHMCLQGKQDYEVSRAESLAVSVGYVGGAFRYTYPGENTAEDVLAVLSDGGEPSFVCDNAASLALASGVVKAPDERWALDSFAKTMSQLRAEASRLSENVSSRWDPSHYCEPTRPWVLRNPEAAELAFVQELSGGFDARAMLIGISESKSFNNFK